MRMDDREEKIWELGDKKARQLQDRYIPTADRKEQAVADEAVRRGKRGRG